MGTIPIPVVPSIFNLNNDILHHIFHLNTYTDETEYQTLFNRSEAGLLPHLRPLHVARQTSQVCHDWRQLLVESPSIWGCMIDMAMTATKSDKWSQLVLSRASASPTISIYGSVGHQSLIRSRSFFASLVKENWHRVRKLNICIDSIGFIDKATWEIMWSQPGPELEAFTVIYDTVSSALSSAIVTGPLFPSGVPSLRRFHCTLFTLDPQASWTSQLSSVTLSHPLTVLDVLNVVSRTVLLESLVIFCTRTGSINVEWPQPMPLPHLVRLHMEDISISNSLLYLQHLSIKPECSLVLDAKDTQDTFVEHLPTLLKKTVSHFEAYFKNHHPSNLKVIMGWGSFSLLSARPTDMEYFGRPGMALKVELRTQGNRNAVEPSPLHSLFGALSSISLDGITDLELFDAAPDNRWTSAKNPQFLNFMETRTVKLGYELAKLAWWWLPTMLGYLG